ncbi:MAG: hypothetical protein KGH79_03345 [Patescibacteria group bacterium]|nr:hypothetical protein [Patescibacteria group bacterium]
MTAVLGILGLLAAGGVAFAQTTSTATNTAVSAPIQQMVLQVGQNGKVLLRGTVDSVTATSITVKSWGGDWTINVPASAQVMPQGAALSSFQTGDFVGVQGTVNSSASWTVDATLVRDWTERQAMNQQIKTNVQSVRQEMQSGTPRTIQGTVSGLSGESFTLTAQNGTVYSVSVASGAKILQKNWLTLDFTQVQNGDTVRVWGPVASSTISASIFRDISIPR